MLDMQVYWNRVEKAARECLNRPGLDQQLVSYSRSVLLSDLREAIEEMKEEQGEQTD